MITFRREHLDRLLQEAVPLMTGKVLDIGGKKKNKRGNFCPPLHQVETWEYLNPDESANPDYVASAENLPINDHAIDVVIMTEVLEYLEHPEQAISETYRILKPGGYALISVPLLNPVHGDWQFDRYRFTKIRLMELAASAGFQSISITEMGSVGSVIFDILHAANVRASHHKKSIKRKLLSKVLKASIPLFGIIDQKTEDLRQFITTGYFLRLTK